MSGELRAGANRVCGSPGDQSGRVASHQVPGTLQRAPSILQARRPSPGDVVMTALARSQQSDAERLAAWIHASPPHVDSVWQINGSAGAGKTTLLRRTAEI